LSLPLLGQIQAADSAPQIAAAEIIAAVVELGVAAAASAGKVAGGYRRQSIKRNRLAAGGSRNVPHRRTRSRLRDGGRGGVCSVLGLRKGSTW
jgi:hypothetical protein